MTTAAIAISSIVGRARGAVRRGLLVSLSLEGMVAVGEASPLPGRSAESIEDVVAALTRLGPRLEVDLARPMDAVDVALPASLRFALETAASGLARAVDGPYVVPKDPESQALGDDLGSLDDVREAMAAGSRSFKLKIRSKSDSRRAVALRELAPAARIRVDANRAFPTSRDVPWDLLRAARVEWIEEPVPSAHTLRDTPVPVALDESLEDDLERALDAIRAGHIAAVVLKPTLLGARGLLSISAIAHAHGVRTVVSHAFESEVGRRAALDLATAIAPGECHGLARWPGIESFRAEEPFHAVPSLV